MFQTHIHLWLQQFDQEVLIDFFRIVTQFGGKKIFLLLLSFLLFFVDLEKGFVILQIALITILVTLGLKVAFNLPRPYHVDSRVQLWDEDLKSVQLPYEQKVATHFWGNHQEEAVQFFRDQELHTWGFPSGHTSLALAFWGSLALLFRKKWLTGLCFTLILLIPFSRMYLGVHFLGDLLGGYLVGAILLLVFYASLIRPLKHAPPVRKKQFSPIWALGLPFIPLSVWGWEEVQGLTLLAYLMAAYASHWLAVRQNIWRQTAERKEKFLRWVIAGGLFLVLGFLLGKLEYIFSLKTHSYWPILKNFSHLFGFFFGALWITSKLMKQQN
jgi:membrane-associated phospholipid phosphatase